MEIAMEMRYFVELHVAPHFIQQIDCAEYN